MLFDFRKRYVVVGYSPENGEIEIDLETFRAEDDVYAMRIFRNDYCTKYLLYDLTLYRITFFGIREYVTDNIYKR